MHCPAASITFSPLQLHFDPTVQVSHLPSTHCLPAPHDVSEHLQVAAWFCAMQSGVSPEHVDDVQASSHLPFTHFCDKGHCPSDEQVLNSAFFVPLFKDGADASPYPSFTLFAIWNDAESSKRGDGE